MGYTLYTSSSDFMQNDGTALVQSEIKVNAGTVKQGGNVAADGPADATNVVTALGVRGGVAGMENAVGPASWASAVTATGTIANASSPWVGSMLVSDTATAHGQSVGNSVRLSDVAGTSDGVYRVVKDVSANTFVVNGAFTATATGVTINYAQATSSTDSTIKPVGYLSAGRYAMRGVSLSTYNGTADVDIMTCPGSEYARRKVHSVTAARTDGVEAAIRAGYWHPFSGVFTTAPTAANNFAGMGADNEITGINGNIQVGGEFNYRYAVTNTTGNYGDIY